ncbi:hypothetical protein BAE44_0012483 [Dichanthelium oligosanthes]|uniref:Uncharacterized protein n=1 Tax=Dichanthelium oligosanthes TaxID=888268 RepID=A0A1E5VMZ3_9POAL|nr:hypothetical protein BAE44_0012483 [Dichanthelium oligosanthes]
MALVLASLFLYVQKNKIV